MAQKSEFKIEDGTNIFYFRPLENLTYNGVWGRKWEITKYTDGFDSTYHLGGMFAKNRATKADIWVKFSNRNDR